MSDHCSNYRFRHSVLKKFFYDIMAEYVRPLTFSRILTDTRRFEYFAADVCNASRIITFVWRIASDKQKITVTFGSFFSKVSEYHIPGFYW